MPPHPLDAIDPTAARLIRAKVRRLTAGPAYRAQDRDDLLQDFALDLLRRKSAYDPARASWEAFVIVVTENRAATLLEARRAAKRTPRNEAGSLNAPAPGPDERPGERGDWIPADAAGRHRGRVVRADTDSMWLPKDVAYVLTTLPPELRAVGECLMAESPAATARRLRLSRSTVYARMAALRVAFGSAELFNYL